MQEDRAEGAAGSEETARDAGETVGEWITDVLVWCWGVVTAIWDAIGGEVLAFLGGLACGAAGVLDMELPGDLCAADPAHQPPAAEAPPPPPQD